MHLKEETAVQNKALAIKGYIRWFLFKAGILPPWEIHEMQVVGTEPLSHWLLGVSQEYWLCEECEFMG